MAYIGNSPATIQQARTAEYEFTATAGQTVFSGVDNNGLTLDLLNANQNEVFFNGSRLVSDDDFTVSGDTLTLTSSAAAGDILVIKTQSEVLNAGSYTKAESDSRYVNYSGDIINGNLQVVGTVTSTDLQIDSGTANGVTYLNGSKVLTSGSALTFDGTNLSSSGGVTFQGGPTGYGGGEVRLGTDASGQQSAISTFSVDSPGLFFDHRGTSNTGVFVWRNGTAAANELARLTSTGLGIGQNSPTGKLDVAGDAGIYVRPTGAAGTYLKFSAGTANGNTYITASANSGGFPPLVFQTGGGDKMHLDSSGNLGLGVTPSAWSVGKAFELRTAGNGLFSNGAGEALVVANSYYDGSWKYAITGGYAAQYICGNTNGTHIWKVASTSGTAGNAISFTQAMTLDADGNLLVGGTTAFSPSSGRGNISINGSSASILGLGVGSAQVGYLFHDGTNMNLYNDKNGYLKFATSGIDRLQIDSSGKIGIGSINPQFKLHLNNPVTIPNNRYLTDFDGVSEVSSANHHVMISVDDDTSTLYPKAVGITLHNESQTDNTFAPAITWGNQSNSGNFSQSTAAIAGRRTSQSTDANWHGGELHFYTAVKSVSSYGVGLRTRMIIDDAGRVTMPYQPAFRATGDNTTFTLTNTVPAVVIFKVAETNIGNVYNTANGRFTVPISGVYTLSASLLISTGGATRVDLHFRKNGGVWLDHEFRDGGAVSTNASFNISIQGYLYTGDFVEVVTVLHGANGGIYQEPKFWNFSGALLG